MQFDPQKYWQQRLEDKFDLDGVGYKGLSLRANKKLYEIRKISFERIVKKSLKFTKKLRVLDVGCGTGFYINLWQKLGVHEISGIDITEVSVRNLSEKYSNYNFYIKDITKDLEHEFYNKYDVVSFFDVIFHIVDDEKLENAIINFKKILKNDGLIFISDFFSNYPTIRKRHIVFRNKQEVYKLMIKHGFEIELRLPMFYLLDDPIDTNNRFIKRIFPYFMKFSRKSIFFEKILLFILFPLEKFLIYAFEESPSTEIVVFRLMKNK